MSQELQVIQDYYALSTYLLQRIQRFPRNLRHGLGRSLELRLEALLALLIRAKYAPRDNKAVILDEVNVELEVVRFQLRQITELKALPLNGQHHALERLQQIGQQVGGWLKQVRGHETKAR